MIDHNAAAQLLFGGTTPTQPAQQTQSQTTEKSQADRIYGNSAPPKHEDVYEAHFKAKEQPQPRATQHDTQVAQDIGQAMEGLLKEQGLVADQHSDALAEFLKTTNLGVDQAKALTELHRARVQEQEDQQFAVWHEAAQREFQAVDLTPAKELLRSYADDELLELLDRTGAGSHPAVVRMLHKLSQDW
jgi:hypothetical protein